MRVPPGSRPASRRFLVLAAIAIATVVACGAPADTIAPTLELVGIADGAQVDVAELIVEVRAEDDRAVASVRYLTDHGSGGPCIATGGDGYLCGPIHLPLGPTTVAVTAVDQAGRVASVTVRLERVAAVDATPPELMLSGAADGATVVTDAIFLTAVATDDDAVAGVRFATDHGVQGVCGPIGADAFTCGPIPLPLGVTVVTVTAEDAAGNAATVSIALTRVLPPDPPPDVTPPVLIVSGIADGATVTTGSVTLIATATDDRGVTAVTYATDHGASGACGPPTASDYLCGPIPLPLGPTTITVRAEDAAKNATAVSLAVSRVAPDGTEGFDIELVFFDESFTATQRAAFLTAVDRWEELVIGDLEDLPVALPAGAACGWGEPAYTGTIDDLLIFATSFAEGAGGLLGAAGPCRIRGSGPDAGTSVVGIMRFDTFDLAVLEANDDLVETIVHEMAHVLGFGSLWELPPFHDLLEYVPSAPAGSCRDADAFLVPPSYVGASGVAAWHELGGTGAVPVEASGGPGTRCGHWEEATFDRELMTGYLDAAMTNPLSALSVRSLEDLGLSVDASGADPYVLPASPALRRQGGYDLAAAEVVLAPLGTIEPATSPGAPARLRPLPGAGP
jgi:hypothetical protein